MNCFVYDFSSLKQYKYVVTFARYKEKWIVCKHKKRATWETSGGHIEDGESPLSAAKRELFEETGALDFDIISVCDFSVEDDTEKSNGQVFLAYVKEIGKLPESEMECIGFFEEFPEDLTYPDITKAVMPYVLRKFIA